MAEIHLIGLVEEVLETHYNEYMELIAVDRTWSDLSKDQKTELLSMWFETAVVCIGDQGNLFEQYDDGNMHEV